MGDSFGPMAGCAGICPGVMGAQVDRSAHATRSDSNIVSELEAVRNSPKRISAQSRRSG